MSSKHGERRKDYQKALSTEDYLKFTTYRVSKGRVTERERERERGGGGRDLKREAGREGGRGERQGRGEAQCVIAYYVSGCCWLLVVRFSWPGASFV